MASEEFKGRCRAWLDDVIVHMVCDSADFCGNLDLTVHQLVEAAKLLKRPWTKDCRGIPLAALLATEKFLSASLLCLNLMIGAVCFRGPYY